jgi:hypothetical protein
MGTAALGCPGERCTAFPPFVILSGAERFAFANRSAESKDLVPDSALRRLRKEFSPVCSSPDSNKKTPCQDTGARNNRVVLRLRCSSLANCNFAQDDI